MYEGSWARTPIAEASTTLGESTAPKTGIRRAGLYGRDSPDHTNPWLTLRTFHDSLDIFATLRSYVVSLSSF